MNIYSKITKPTRMQVLTVVLSLHCLPLFAAGAPQTPCDILAANPSDPNKVAEGVNFEKINSEVAVIACKGATDTYPADARLQYQYGRALDAKEDFAGALTWYGKAKDQNYAPAFEAISALYYYGLGVAKNLTTAFQLSLQGANLNYAPSQYSVGLSYDFGEGVASSLSKALEWYLKSANQNYGPAQNEVGEFYYLPRGLAKDLNKAFEWYQKSANNGYSYGFLNVGKMYHNGESVSKDNNKAMQQWLKASELGLVQAKVELVFSWAEVVLRDYLPGFARSFGATLPAPYDNYQYRYYTQGGVNIYAAYNHDNNHLYYYGPLNGNKIQDLGVLDPFYNSAKLYASNIK